MISVSLHGLYRAQSINHQLRGPRLNATFDKTKLSNNELPTVGEPEIMAQVNYWDGSDDSDTDAADAANLAQQPESANEHRCVDIYFPSLQRIKARKLNQLKTDLRNKFNITTIEVCERTCMLSLSGYGFDRQSILREVKHYDSNAS